MASWMIHLRVADRLLDEIPGLSEAEFVVGNIAPDSGVPNEDWTSFTPSKQISHYKRPGMKALDIQAFIDDYFTAEKQRSYPGKEYAFFLGYLTHLLTDIAWSAEVARPTFSAYPERYANDKLSLIWEVKRDWYDQDHLFLREHPDFRAFRIYENAAGFQNSYMPAFPSDAFSLRQAYVVDFYHKGSDSLLREYPYFDQASADRFVENCVAFVLSSLKAYI